MTRIDWHSEESHVLLNPRLPAEVKRRLEHLAGDAGLRSHVWIATSGSTGDVKLCGLSKKAILASAAAVNRHLEATASDGWCCVMPEFHVGALGIHARAFLTGSRIITADWDAQSFTSIVAERGCSLASLVPAQVFDLVRAGLRSPSTLRAVIVGGAALNEDLYRSARELRWSLLPSYGMTECASQIATASLQSLRAGTFPELHLLSHLKARAEPDRRLAFSGASLLTAYASESNGHPEVVDPKVDGWFLSEDCGSVESTGVLQIEGRVESVLKIGGELTNLDRLQQLLDSLPNPGEPWPEAALIALPDERLGQTVAMAFAGDATRAEELVNLFNQRVLPFERIRKTVQVDSIPRTPLGKVLRQSLLSMII